MNIRYKRSLAVLLALFLLLAFAFSMLSYATDATEEIGLTPSPWEYRSALISNSSVASSQIESILTLAKKEANTTVISKLRKILTRGTYRIAALGGSSWPYDNNMPNAVGSISASESGLDTTVSFAAGWGCFAYASFASSYSRGVNVSRVWNGVSAPSVSQIQEFFHRYLDPGEHVHFYYGGTEHSILYLASNSDDSGFYYAEWSGTIQVAYSSYSQFKDALDAHSGGSLYIQDTNTGVDVIDYIDTCSMSSTNAVFEANGTGGYIKSLPCSSQTNAESTTLRALVSGEVLTVTNTVVNLSGNTWYQISLNGGNYYVFSGHVDFVNYVDDVMISAPNPPKATLTHGQPFNLSETVSSRHVVTKITGQILGSAGSVVFSGTYTPNKSGSLNISGSTIDTSLLFNNLSSGSYTYKLVAEVTTDCPGAGYCTKYTETFTSDFTISGGTAPVTGGSDIEAESPIVSRTDGIWLFPLSSGYYQKFSDWCCCPGYGTCAICGTSHSSWGDSSHTSNYLGHQGIDVYAPTGTEVKAAADGKVYWTSSCLPSRGYTIVMEHSLGNGYSYYSVYQHLSKNNIVASGTSVAAGTKIGTVGSTGDSTGPHLHFGIVLDTSGKGSSMAASDGGLTPTENKGWLRTAGYRAGRIITNPALNSLAGFPTSTAGATLAAIKAHAGSVLYTFDSSKVSIGEQTTVEYTLTINASVGGTLSVTAVGNIYVNGDTIAENTSVTISAIPDDGYSLSDLTVNGQSFTSGSSYKVTNNASISAIFVPAAVSVTYHSSVGDIISADSVVANTDYVITTNYPKISDNYFCGWAYSPEALAYEVRPGDTLSKLNNNIDLYPVYVSHEQAISGAEVFIYKIEDFDFTNYNVQIKTHQKPVSIDTSCWSEWSDWSTTVTVASASVEVKNTPMFRYYYFLCPRCNRHEPYLDTCDCGNYSLTASDAHLCWSHIAYTACSPQSFSYTTAKKYTTSLGDGQMWIFSSGNINNTAIGTTDTDSSAIVIKQGYSFRSWIEQSQTSYITYYGYIITPLSITPTPTPTPTVTPVPSVTPEPTGAIVSAKKVNCASSSSISIPVNIQNNPGIMGCKITFSYDPDVFTAPSVAAGELLQNGTFTNSIGGSSYSEGSFFALWSKTEQITGDGCLVTLGFTISDDADGDYAIAISYTQDDTYNEQYENVTLNCQSISVNVKDFIYGDANGDDEVGNKDVAYLARYLVGKEVMDALQLAASDVNGDGDVGNKDVAYLARYLVGKEDGLGVKRARQKNNAGLDTKAAIKAETIGCTAGDEISIPIMLSDNPGIMGYRITLTYDPGIFDAPTVDRGTLTQLGSFNTTIGGANYTPGSFDVLWSSDANVSTDGSICMVKFTVASTAEGEYSIGLTYKQSDTFNESYEDVVLSCLPISVTVSAQSPSPTPTATPEIIYGDANKDRAVTAADASLVLRWIVVELAPDKEIDLVAANITGGSTVTAADAAMILRWVVNLESSRQPKS